VVEVRYHRGGALVPLAEALRGGLDLAQAQVWRRHRSGLEVWVNRDPRAQWSVRAGQATYTLPPNGWLAFAPAEPFLAYSALVAGNRADFCRCAEYSFLNVRTDVARRIEGITTDGIAAFQRSAVEGRDDVVLVAGRSLTLEIDAYRLSERGDVSLQHRSPDELEIAALDSDSGKSLLVTFPAFSPAWETGPWEVAEWLDGDWRRSSAQIQPTKQGLQLGRAQPGGVYRLRARGEES
jgi:hypothetical protein